MNELISIVIPAYNIEGYLSPTLDSILAQTYTNLEIIVVNDGSKDKTGAVADTYAAKDTRIRVIHKENGGVTSARLRGVAEARGEYIGFVDGDDFIEPQMYARLMENLQAHDADISHCGYQMVFPSRVDYYYNTGKLLVQKEKQGCTDLLNGYFIEPGLWNKLYKKELFMGLDDWMDRSIRINEDLLMNFYLFRKAETAVFEDSCPYHYVLRKGSAATSRLNAHKLQDPLRVLHLLLEETAEEPDWHRILERRLAYQLLNTATLGLGDQRDLIAPVRKNARRELRERLPAILAGNACGVKLKVMALWAAVWPWSYCIVHKFFSICFGTAHKYDVQ